MPETAISSVPATATRSDSSSMADIGPGMSTHDEAPFYLPAADEVELFHAAYDQRIPVLLKGPTGCGKTRFVEHMAWQIARERGEKSTPSLVTVTCHDDMTASDLVGRYLLSTDGTTWLDGPLTQAVRSGAICYLDEVVEARKDTTVVLHALTDHRRMLPVERLGTTIPAHPDFLLVVSYNPGYQATVKDLKPSTRQRFMAIEFGYPTVDLETRHHRPRVRHRRGNRGFVGVSRQSAAQSRRRRHHRRPEHAIAHLRRRVDPQGRGADARL